MKLPPGIPFIVKLLTCPGCNAKTFALHELSDGTVRTTCMGCRGTGTLSAPIKWKDDE